MSCVPDRLVKLRSGGNAVAHEEETKGGGGGAGVYRKVNRVEL